MSEWVRCENARAALSRGALRRNSFASKIQVQAIVEMSCVGILQLYGKSNGKCSRRPRSEYCRFTEGRKGRISGGLCRNRRGVRET